MIKISYREENTPTNDCEDHTLLIDGVDGEEDEAYPPEDRTANISNDRNDIDGEDPLQISDEEIREKINASTDIDDNQKQQLMNLIHKYKRAFEKKKRNTSYIRIRIKTGKRRTYRNETIPDTNEIPRQDTGRSQKDDGTWDNTKIDESIHEPGSNGNKKGRISTHLFRRTRVEQKGNQ